MGLGTSIQQLPYATLPNWPGILALFHTDNSYKLCGSFLSNVLMGPYDHGRASVHPVVSQNVEAEKSSSPFPHDIFPPCVIFPPHWNLHTNWALSIQPFLSPFDFDVAVWAGNCESWTYLNLLLAARKSTLYCVLFRSSARLSIEFLILPPALSQRDYGNKSNFHWQAGKRLSNSIAKPKPGKVSLKKYAWHN